VKIPRVTGTTRFREWVALVGALAWLALGAGDAQAANECNGLDVCISVPGPWVVVPARGEVRWRLQCPQRDLIVGGTDAVVSDPGVDVSFLARTGSPVNPGISTRRAATFVAVQAHEPRVASFRPFLGCIPTSGGGGRETTSRAASFPPGDPARRASSTRAGRTSASSRPRTPSRSPARSRRRRRCSGGSSRASRPARAAPS
jgi:hypothetical protein